MTATAIDLSGIYEISAVTSTTIAFVDPELVNPSWLYADLDGSGTTGYSRDIGISLVSSGHAVDLAGTYTVTSVSPTEIHLASPDTVNGDWNYLTLFPDAQTKLLSAFVSKTQSNWIGPFIVEASDASILIANFVAEQGLYKDNGKKQQAFPITIELEATPVDINDDPNGPPQTFTATIPGNPSGRESRAVTMVCQLTTPGRCSIRARRITDTDYAYKGTVIDEVKWKDCYSLASTDAADFGDVTTIHVRNYATASPTAVKERKINCRATRQVSVRNPDDTFGPALAPSRNAADIICHMALDPHIGRRSLAELAVADIYDAVSEVQSYFGIPEAGYFSHTFDDATISFEEMVQTVAQAVFCMAYRQGSLFRLSFERSTEDSILLFNHRNKLPGSETRTVRFGTLDDADGVEFDYVSPVDGAKLTLYLPADRSATKPKKLERIGVQDERVAFLHAARAWNKMRYQNMSAAFDALAEATQLVLNQRIEITDNTRPDVHDGHVVSQQGLTLELSQPFAPDPAQTYLIFLQLPTGEVEVLPVVAGPSPTTVVLQQPVTVDLVFDAAADVAYQIVGSAAGRSTAFLVTEKGAFDRRSLKLQAINYDARYYQDDLTYNL
jgi:hypothetical protein